MVLVCMMALVENEEVNLVDGDEASHQKVVKLLSDNDQHIAILELLIPGLFLLIVLPLGGSTMVSANGSFREFVDNISLLFDKIICWNYENGLQGSG